MVAHDAKTHDVGKIKGAEVSKKIRTCDESLMRNFILFLTTCLLYATSTYMKYEIVTTNIFDKWLTGVKDTQHRARIISRFDHIQLGNFGDYKKLSGNLFELRFFFGSGFRIYYTIKGEKVVFLLCGGDKSTQRKDIKKAKTMMDKME